MCYCFRSRRTLENPLNSPSFVFNVHSKQQFFLQESYLISLKELKSNQNAPKVYFTFFEIEQLTALEPEYAYEVCQIEMQPYVIYLFHIYRHSLYTQGKWKIQQQMNLILIKQCENKIKSIVAQFQIRVCHMAKSHRKH